MPALSRQFRLAILQSPLMSRLPQEECEIPEAVQNIGRAALRLVNTKSYARQRLLLTDQYLYTNEYLKRTYGNRSNTVQNCGRMGNRA